MAPAVVPGLLAAAGVVGAAGVATAGYALWEARQYVLRRADVPVLPAGSEDLTILHISDLHLTHRSPDRERWVASLADLRPDLVVATGDFLSSRTGLSRLPVALGGLLDRPGVFVFGSNDYFEAKRINPTKYLKGPSKHPRRKPTLPATELTELLTGHGWCDLNNATGALRVHDLLLSFVGVGDPHIRLDRYREVAGRWAPGADLRVGVTHAPYLRILDAMAEDGAEVIFAGHTHGGQVCVPGYGALVTNCDLDRQRVKGLSRHETAHLHVSAGLGTNPHTPIRLACRPEATLLTLRPAGR